MAGSWLMGAGTTAAGQRPTAVLVAVHPEESDGTGPGSETP